MVNTDQRIPVKTRYHQVKEVKDQGNHAYLIRLEKKELAFKAGQYVVLRLPEGYKAREYSIYSGEDDPFLDVLVKEIDEGSLSRKLKRINKGDELEVHGPLGYFTLDREVDSGVKHVLIASGTGIAPFHSYIRTNPELDYQIIHGITSMDESYGKEDFDHYRYVACTSRDASGNYHGRITGYLESEEIDVNAVFYLCGNSQMINDAIQILKKKGVTDKQIYTEIYF
jgi:ferredoxin--NADP+ reductase/benzoate/toluate 1,2-dioxygenase reductase subunit